METLVTSPVSTKFQASLYKVNDVRSKLKGGGMGARLIRNLDKPKKNTLISKIMKILAGEGLYIYIYNSKKKK